MSFIYIHIRLLFFSIDRKNVEDQKIILLISVDELPVFDDPF